MAVVLGYHGCDQKTAQKLLGGSPFGMSNRPYDWLGGGTYFWQDDPLRAYRWAQEWRSEAPCLVGAVIELGNCLDLTTQQGISLVKLAYAEYVELQTATGRPVPANQDAKNATPGDRVLRFLDRAVIDFIHSGAQTKDNGVNGEDRFDTVRALFQEGESVYPGAGFFAKTHLQIAVRNERQVLGVFRVPAWQLQELGIADVYGD